MDLSGILLGLVAGSLTYGALTADFFLPRRAYLGTLAVLVWLALVLRSMS